MRLIDAAALTDVVWKSRYENPHSEGRARMAHHNEHSRFLAMIDHAPTIEARPVVRGVWIEVGSRYVCSVCKKRALLHFGGFGHCLSAFCPNCGADMRGDDDG